MEFRGDAKKATVTSGGKGLSMKHTCTMLCSPPFNGEGWQYSDRTVRLKLTKKSGSWLYVGAAPSGACTRASSSGSVRLSRRRASWRSRWFWAAVPTTHAAPS